MVDFINRIGHYTHDAYEVCVKKVKGVLVTGTEGGQILHDIYSMEGILNLSKFAIANLRWIEVVFSVKDVFTQALSSLETLKDLHYATFSFIMLPEFITKTPDGHYKFTLPTFRNPLGEYELDLVKILFAIGSPCELGGFLKKNNVFKFEFCTHIANRMGSCKVFSWFGIDRPLDKIPTLDFLCINPRSFFFFWASVGDCARWLRFIILPIGKTTEERTMCRSKQFELLTLLRVVASFGRAVALYGGRYYGSKVWFVTIQLAAQYATLEKFILNRQREREERFYHPVAPAA